MCGADDNKHDKVCGKLGSPPRVRSRHRGYGRGNARRRITSACAEQTSQSGTINVPNGDHLRVCGADVIRKDYLPGEVGSPPRVRSRRRHYRPGRSAPGITSACAEQTRIRVSVAVSCGDHLRVCGADLPQMKHLPWSRGSPPRVRSRPVGEGSNSLPFGITSACAEQTRSLVVTVSPVRDHLRVCGAD